MKRSICLHARLPQARSPPDAVCLCMIGCVCACTCVLFKFFSAQVARAWGCNRQWGNCRSRRRFVFFFQSTSLPGAKKLAGAGKLGPKPLARQRGRQLLPRRLPKAPSTQHCARGRKPRKRKFAELVRKCYIVPPQPLARSEVCRVFDGRISEAQHLRFHAGCKSFCIRCDFNKNREDYEAYAMYACDTWLSARSRNGMWGIGCKLCAAFSEARSSRSPGVRCSKFANFQIRPKTKRRARFLILQHRESQTHRRVCVGARAPPVSMKSPQPLARKTQISQQPLARICQTSQPMTSVDALQSPLLLSESSEDAVLLKGNVPSPSDWQESWALLSETASLRQEARMHEKRQSVRTVVANRRRKRHRAPIPHGPRDPRLLIVIAVRVPVRIYKRELRARHSLRSAPYGRESWWGVIP